MKRILLIFGSVTALGCLLAVTVYACQLLSAARADAVEAQASLVEMKGALSDARSDLKDAKAQISTLSTKVNKLVDTTTATSRKIGVTLDKVNAGCAPGPCGTLANVDKTLNTFRLTAGQAEIAFNHEDKNLTSLDAQELTLFNDLDSAIVGAKPVEDGLTRLSLDFDAIALNPDIPEIVRNFAAALASLGHMLSTADAVETKATHDYLHPSKNPLVRTWKVAEPFLLPFAQIGAAAATAIK